MEHTLQETARMGLNEFVNYLRTIATTCFVGLREKIYGSTLLLDAVGETGVVDPSGRGMDAIQFCLAIERIIEGLEFHVNELAELTFEGLRSIVLGAMEVEAIVAE